MPAAVRRFLAAALLTAAGPAAAADLPGDPVAGQDLAERWCAECHQIAGEPPEAVFEGEPPAFAAVADDPAVTEIALRAFLQTPHANMPNIMLTREQTDDIVAYILSLRRR
ncbi:MAG TPA: cytochrome c [Geminicoccaceae bacterium]|nr:cytochrome c [Geminicoccaceae bacterium]